MTRVKYLMAASMIALIGAFPFSVAAQPAEDPHHPAQGSAGAAPTPNAGRQSGAMPGQQAMMGAGAMMGGMPMMNMMAMMMGGGDASAMGMAEHVEGRIAFLRTELKLTDAQTGSWNEFAAALRENARTLEAARPAMMAEMGCCQPQPQTLTQRLDGQERWLTARLQGVHAIKAAFTKLYATLSDSQKKTADELLAPHMGMMSMMPMGQMGGVAQRVQ